MQGYKLLTAEASEEQIAQLTGMNYGVFTNTVVFAQSTDDCTAKNFIACTDGERKDLFRTLFNLQAYEEAGSLVGPDAKAVDAELLLLKQNATLLEQILAAKQEHYASLQASKLQFEQELATKASMLTTRQTELTGLLSAVDAAATEARHAELTAAIKQQEAVYTKFDESFKQHSSALAVAENKLLTCLSQIQAYEKQQALLSPPAAVEKPVVGSARAEQVQVVADIRDLERFLVEQTQSLAAYNTELATTNSLLLRSKNQLQAKELLLKTYEATHANLTAQLDATTDCPTCGEPFHSPDARAKACAELHARYAASGELLKQTQESCAELQQAIADTQRKLGELASAPPEDRTADITEALSQLRATSATLSSRVADEAAADKAYQTYCAQQASYQTKKDFLRDQLVLLAEERQATTASLPQISAEQAKASNERANCATLLNELRSQEKELLVKLSQEVLPLRNELHQIEHSLKALTTVFPQAAALRELEAVLSTKTTELAALVKQQQVLAEKSTILTQCAEAFGNEGIVAELFKQYFPSMQMLANEYLTLLTNNELSIDFEGEKALKKKVDGQAQVRAQFDVQVKKRKGGSGYQLISGSEQKKAALVCSWALSDLAFQYSNVNCNLRVFDEIFDSLDARSTERLANFLLQHHFDRITFVISHKQELEDVFQQKILLRKENGTTRLG